MSEYTYLFGILKTDGAIEFHEVSERLYRNTKYALACDPDVLTIDSQILRRNEIEIQRERMADALRRRWDDELIRRAVS